MSLHRHIVDNRSLFTALVLNEDIDEEVLDPFIYNLESPVDIHSLYGLTIIKLAYHLYMYYENREGIDCEKDIVEEFKSTLPCQWVHLINHFFEMFTMMSKRPTFVAASGIKNTHQRWLTLCLL